MHPSEFGDRSPGRVVRSLQGHWTFEPHALPPVIEYDADTVSVLSHADLALGRLGEVGRLLPNPRLLVRPFVGREAVLSSRIEGIHTRLEDVLLHDPAARPAGDGDLAEVLNYVAALDYGLARLADGMPLCLRLLRDIHARLMDGVRGARLRPGEFRDCAVMIGRAGQSFEQARFVPPAPAALPELLRDFERFLNTPGGVPVVVQLAVCHYQFEAIHSFMDGNGRLGRLLITLMLCERGVLTQPLLYLSAYLEANNQAYLDGLLSVSRRGAWADWIRFIAAGVAEQAEDAADRARRLVALREDYRRRAQDAGKPAGILTLIDHLFAAPAITAPAAAAVMGVAFPTAQRYVGWLEQAGILTARTGQPRTRSYTAPEIFRLLGATPSEG